MMKNKKIQYLAELSLFVAIILLMSFTPLGYFKTPAFEITFITIPIAIGAIFLGPLAGTILGGVFGLTSFFQAFSGALGLALLSINPIAMFIVCFVPRVLVGLLTGLAAKKMDRNKLFAFVLPSILAPALNTLLFIGFLFGCFWNAPILAEMRTNLGTQNIFIFFAAFVGINALIELAACSVLGSIVAKGLSRIRR